MFDWLRRRFGKREAYRVRIKQGFRECVEVVYSEEGRQVSLGGERVGKDWKQINVEMPSSVPEQDLPRILANLSEALSARRVEFVIFRVGEPEAVPEEEQAAAVRGLRAMGLEPISSDDGRRLELRKLPSMQQSEAKADAVKMMRLVTGIPGTRRPAEVLAKSAAAIAEFL